MVTWESITVQTGVKMFYYPSVNIYELNIDLAKHVKTIPTICLLRNYDKDIFYGKFRGSLFSSCCQIKLIPERGLRSLSERFTTMLFWAAENLPDDETVLVPSANAGTYSYWSNPESAVLAKLSLT